MGKWGSYFVRSPGRKAHHSCGIPFPIATKAQPSGLLTIYPFRWLYDADILDLFHRLGSGYVGRILKGTKPADILIERPTKFDLAINIRTAKTLGLTVAPALFATADEVIE